MLKIANSLFEKQGSLESSRIVDDISVVKNNMELIEVISPPDIGIEFQQLTHPFGRCLNLGPGIRARNKPVEFLRVLINSGNSTDENKIRVVFKDPINGEKVKPIGLKCEGMK